MTPRIDRNLQKHPIIDLQNLGQSLSHFLTDRSLAVFHFREIALGNSKFLREFNLRQLSF